MSASSDQLSKSGLASYRGSVAVTPSDSVDLSPTTRGIICDVGGVVKLTFVDDTTDTLTLISGLPYTFQVKRVFSSVTAATGIHALY